MMVDTNNTITLELTQEQAKTLAKQVIQHAEDAPTTLLNFAYLLNEAHSDAANSFRQPPHAWEPGAIHPSAD